MLPERSNPNTRYTGSSSAVAVSVTQASTGPAPPALVLKPPMDTEVVLPNAAVVPLLPPVLLEIAEAVLGGSGSLELDWFEPQAVAAKASRRNARAGACRMADEGAARAVGSRAPEW